MLQMRAAQIEAVRKAGEAGFEEDVIAHLRANHAEAITGLPEDVLCRRVRTAIARARGHQLSLQSSIGSFVALMFEVAPNFDQHLAIRQALAQPALTPEERLDSLNEEVSIDDWMEAKEQSDDTAWGS